MENIAKDKIKQMTQCAIFAALLCVCSPIAIPVGPVPITLSLFAVMICGIILGVGKSFTAVLIYILLGSFGLPVFSGAKGGFGIIVGPTGGYIWSYLIMVVVIALLSTVNFKNNFFKFSFTLISCILGAAICYFFGTLQFMCVTEYSLKSALTSCVYPFILFDVIKAVCASILGIKIKKALINTKLM